MRIENISTFKKATAIAPTAISTDTTTVQSTGTNTAGYLAVSFDISCTTFSAGTFTPAITECDTLGGTYTAVADADLYSVAGSTTPEASAALTAAGVKQIAYLGSKQFVKCNIVSSGSASGTINVKSVLSMPAIAPVA